MKKLNKITSSLVVAQLLASCAEKQIPDSEVLSASHSEAVVSISD